MSGHFPQCRWSWAHCHGNHSVLLHGAHRSCGPGCHGHGLLAAVNSLRLSEGYTCCGKEGSEWALGLQPTPKPLNVPAQTLYNLSFRMVASSMATKPHTETSQILGSMQNNRAAEGTQSLLKNLLLFHRTQPESRRTSQAPCWQPVAALLRLTYPREPRMRSWCWN